MGPHEQSVTAALLQLALATAVLVGFFSILVRLGRIIDAIEKVLRRRKQRRGGPEPSGRPIEMLAADVRRLRRECALVPAGAPMARRRAIQLAYDDALVETAASLGVAEQVSAFPIGTQRDLERLRLEAELEAAGIALT